MPATSPKSDATLVANLRANIKTLRAALDASEEHCTLLAASVLELTPHDTTDVYEAVLAFKPSPGAVQRAMQRLEAWQAARTNRGVVVAAYVPDPLAKFVGTAYNPGAAR